MYIVTLYNDGVSIEIHNRTEKLYSGIVVKGINTIDSFSFSMLPSNAGFNKTHDFKTLVSVYNTRKNRYEFWGRVLCSTSSMSENGLITKDITCESFFGFFCDSLQSYIDTRNWTVHGLLEHLLDVHNSQLEESKHFYLGEVTVTDDNDNLYVGIQRNNTWETLKGKLLDKLGGEFRFRVVDGVTYLDYLPEIGETRATKIALSRNMKAITKEIDPSSLITRLIPLGAKLGEDTEERLTIEKANNGIPYIDDVDAVEMYGIHVGCVEFDDVTVASNLLRKGKEWLIANNKVPVKYSITALDLSLLGYDIDDFEVCNYHPIENALLGIDDVARIIKETIDVCEETRSTIEVGENFKTSSDIQREQYEKLVATGSTVSQLQETTNKLQKEMSNTSQNMDELRQEVTEQSTNILNESYRIIMTALEKYVQTSDYEQFQQTIEAQFQIMSREIAMKFTTTTEQITAVNGDMQTKFAQMYKHISFTENGISINDNNGLELVIDNDMISFKKNGVQFGWWDGVDFHTGNIVVEVSKRAQFGNFAFVPRNDGSLSFVKVGE